ncbi:MAG: hypothetical protein WC924_02350 [Candidatus Gracilibacteria bacterium]
MKLKKYLLAFAVVLLVSGCTTSVDDWGTITDDGYEIEHNGVNPDWEMLDQGDFTLYAPSGWALTPEQGIDSYVGTISGDGMSLKYAYGENVGALSYNSEYLVSEYNVMAYETFDEHEVVIYTPKILGEGNTEIDFESPRGEGNFILFGENLTSEQEEVALQIFGTIYFK